jgi:hypothetical protein
LSDAVAQGALVDLRNNQRAELMARIDYGERA